MPTIQPALLFGGGPTRVNAGGSTGGATIGLAAATVAIVPEAARPSGFQSRHPASDCDSAFANAEHVAKRSAGAFSSAREMTALTRSFKVEFSR